MLSLNVYTPDNETHNFICASFQVLASGDIRIHFDNGYITIDAAAFEELIIYPHNAVATTVLDPGLLGKR